MTNDHSRREFLFATSGAAALGLTGCLTPALTHFEVKPMNTNIETVIDDVQRDLNNCAKSQRLYEASIRAADVNGDGVINSLDLLMLYDNYNTRGENIKEDVNKDGVVNALDTSIVIQNYGRVVAEVESQPSRGLTNPGQLNTTPSN